MIVAWRATARLIGYLCKLYATTRIGNCAGGREGYQALSPDQGACKACRAFRGQVSHHRLRAKQLYQLGHLFHLRTDAVQEPVAAAASERGMAVRRPAEDPVRDSGPGPDALGDRDLVPGHGGRHLP